MFSDVLLCAFSTCNKMVIGVTLSVPAKYKHWLCQPSWHLPCFHFSSQEQEKSAQVSRRVDTINEVSENVRRMDELLQSYRRHELSPADQDTLQVNAPVPA